MKYRYVTNSFIYLWCFPTGGFGAAISKGFILYTKPGWRSLVAYSQPVSTLVHADGIELRCFYFLLALNVTSGLLYVLFYHPPTFRMKHRIHTKTQQAKMFDYFGAVLFVAGLIVFEIGFLWGGGVSLIPYCQIASY